MSRLRDLLSQDNIENDIENIIKDFKATSPVSKMMTPKFLAWDKTQQEVIIEFPVQETQLNEHNTMHAGFITAAFDEAFGIMARYLARESATVSINISINFMKPIPIGEAIQITVKPTSLGRSILTVSGECCLSSNGLLTNTALGTFAVVG